MVLVELDILPDEAVGEVLDVALDSGLRVVGAFLDLGELVAAQVELEDLGLVPQGSFGWVVPRPISCRQPWP